MNLHHLTDQQLLIDTKRLVKNERTVLTQVLHHLKEIEIRKLYSDLGYSSLHEYAVKELLYSDPSSSRRIQAARLMIEIKDIDMRIDSGVLSLSNINRAVKFFKKEKIQEPAAKSLILAKLENKSSRECDQILFELTPRPLPKEAIQQVSTDHMQLKINVTNETHKKLDEVKALLACHEIDNDFFSKISDEARENIHRKRFRLTPKGRETSSNAGKNPSNHERRTAFENSKEKVCSICGGCFYLQEDHIIPKARGGTNDPSNLRLLCFNCNQRQRIKAKL